MKKKIIACVLAISCFVGCGTTNKKDIEVIESNTEKDILEEIVETEEVDERYIYPDGKARHEPASGVEAVEGYVKYIKNSSLYEDIQNQEYCYMLAYVTDDEIPDLLLAPTEGSHGGTITLLYYPSYGVTEDDICAIENIGCYNRISFYPWRNVLRTDEPGSMECSGEYYNQVDIYVYENNQLERLAYHEAYYDIDDYENVIEEHYYRGTEQEVSKEEYDSYISELIGDAEEVVFDSYGNENGYHYLDDDALENNLYADEFFNK